VGIGQSKRRKGDTDRVITDTRWLQITEPYSNYSKRIPTLFNQNNNQNKVILNDIPLSENNPKAKLHNIVQTNVELNRLVSLSMDNKIKGALKLNLKIFELSSHKLIEEIKDFKIDSDVEHCFYYDTPKMHILNNQLIILNICSEIFKLIIRENTVFISKLLPNSFLNDLRLKQLATNYSCNTSISVLPKENKIRIVSIWKSLEVKLNHDGEIVENNIISFPNKEEFIIAVTTSDHAATDLWSRMATKREALSYNSTNIKLYDTQTIEFFNKNNERLFYKEYPIKICYESDNPVLCEKYCYFIGSKQQKGVRQKYIFSLHLQTGVLTSLYKLPIKLDDESLKLSVSPQQAVIFMGANYPFQEDTLTSLCLKIEDGGKKITDISNEFQNTLDKMVSNKRRFLLRFIDFTSDGFFYATKTSGTELLLVNLDSINSRKLSIKIPTHFDDVSITASNNGPKI